MMQTQFRQDRQTNCSTDPLLLNLKMIERAERRLRDVVHLTPLERNRTFSEMCGGELYLKYENQQKTGSFKIRGAYNKICELKEQGALDRIVAASAGNHAQGVAFAASALGVQATIVMPKSTPIAKVKATEQYGAEVCLFGDCYDAAYEKALEIQQEENSIFIHPFDDLSVMAGQATIGKEILKAVPGVDAILLPAGGGGLLAGVASYIKATNPRIRIIGVQAEGAPAIKEAYYGHKTNILHASTIADGIAVKVPGQKTQEVINRCVDEMVTVSDAEISSAILLLLERTKQVVEPAGAASLAAVLSGKVDVKDRSAVCVLSGGNIDVSVIHRIIEIGLVSRHRKLKFRTVMPDKPGSLERFSKIMADAFANIVMVQYDRMSAELDPSEVILHIACEVGGKQHGQQVISMLNEAGYQITME